MDYATRLLDVYQQHHLEMVSSMTLEHCNLSKALVTAELDSQVEAVKKQMLDGLIADISYLTDYFHAVNNIQPTRTNNDYF